MMQGDRGGGLGVSHHCQPVGPRVDQTGQAGLAPSANACSTMLPSLDFMKSAPQSEMLAIESEPPGAEARTSLGQSCRTPCQLAVQPSSEFSEAGCGSSPSGSIAAGGLRKPKSSAGACSKGCALFPRRPKGWRRRRHPPPTTRGRRDKRKTRRIASAVETHGVSALDRGRPCSCAIARP